MDTETSPVETLKSLFSELDLLEWEWQQYQALFGSGPAVVEELESMSEGFCALVADSISTQVVLRACRLMDPARRGKGKRFSLENAIIILRAVQFKNSEEAEKRRAGILANAGLLKEARNNALAHNDYRKRFDPQWAVTIDKEVVEHFIFSSREFLWWVVTCLGSELSQRSSFKGITFICEGAMEFRQRLAERRIAMKMIEEKELGCEFEKRLNMDWCQQAHQ